MTLPEPNSPHTDSWWGRASGGREVLRVAAPMVISSLSWTVMTFVDRMFLNWVSDDAMTGAFNASNVWFMLLCLPLGVCTYANTFVAQYDGARQIEKIGALVWQAVWVALACSPVLLLAIPLAAVIFTMARHSPAVTAVEIEYFQILCIGGPAMLVAQSAAAFYSGRGQTQVVMWTDAAFAVVNLVLDYVWIFGYAGFPEWGVAGAAWATVISMWLKATAYLWLFLQAKYRERYGTLAGLRFDPHLFGRLLYFGGPSGLQMVLDVTGFTVFVMLVGRLETGAAATNMTFSISTLAFMPVYGLHLAVGVLVGERLGENRDDLAARATLTTLQIAWIYMLAISLLYLLAPGIFLFGFYPEASALSEKDAAVRHLAILLLRFVAAYNLFDATLMVFAGAIKGAGDTQFILRVSLVLATLLAGGTWLVVEYFRWNVLACWGLVTIWVCSAAIIYAWRFLEGEWRRMRVIEGDGGASSEVVAAAGE
jgi:MATE family multidrug resistance protein